MVADVPANNAHHTILEFSTSSLVFGINRHWSEETRFACRPNLSFYYKGSYKVAVNEAARSAAQLHSAPYRLSLQQRSLGSAVVTLG